MSYDAVLEQALEMSQAKERELADQVASLRAKDVKRVKRIQALNQELAKAYNNIGELNSEIATNGQRIRELETALDDALAMIQESDDDAPNLALAACKKKLEQLEGMLEGQRRSTRELGVNLQRARDEKTLLRAEILRLKGDLNTAQERAKTHQTQRDDLYRRNGQTVQERDGYLKDLQDLQRRVNRAKSILAPTVTMDTSEGSITWEPGTFVRGPARPANAWRCAAMKDGHSCDNTFYHALSDGHHCHCGQWWGGK